MSVEEKSAGNQPSSGCVEESDSPTQPAKPIHTFIGAVFLIVCIALCGNFFGWFSGKSSGLGVSREKVMQPLSKSGLGFRPGADQRGYPTEEATSLDGRSTIRLVGPKDDLVYVSITTNLADKPTDAQVKLQLLYSISLIHSVVPDWNGEEIGMWLNETVEKVAIDPAVAQVEERRGNALVKVSVSRSPITITVSVESGRW
ncbi:MAG: hypothetical protein IPM33_09805 [Phycisphaerales bacterium]|nr:hypothetical protein [Phycisphaerales bacterium]